MTNEENKVKIEQRQYYSRDTSSYNNNNEDNEFLKNKLHLNFLLAIVTGIFATFIGAILWAFITVATGFQFGYMAIALGLLVGFSIRIFGASTERRFGILGGILAFVGCLLGNLFSQIGFIAQELSCEYIDVIAFLNFKSIIEIYKESFFNAIDILFYALAIVEGYKISFIKPSNDTPENKNYFISFKYRIILAVISFLIVIFTCYKLIFASSSGERIYRYESGEIYSIGELKNGKNVGEWRFYYESGDLFSKGEFRNNIKDGYWEFYYENGNLKTTGIYKNGLENGAWINYYENGNIYDSVNYLNGRKEGKCISRYENGNILQEGYYKHDQEEREWKSYYDNGNILEEIFYNSDGDVEIKNSWSADGQQIIENGNGCYIADGKNILYSGEIKNGRRIGIWEYFFTNGKLREERIFEEDVYKILNAWNNQGNRIVENGFGRYISYYINDSTIMETGDVSNGYKIGAWRTYYLTGNLLSEVNYVQGKQSGLYVYYYDSGVKYVEGEIVDDKPEGEWHWYHETEILSSRVNFINGKKEGEQIFYDVTSKELKKEIYKNGELIDVIIM
jgi:antitoxin component YwqK of YwqJK toxin-antitoxin module